MLRSLRAPLLLAVVVILAACGGSDKPTAPQVAVSSIVFVTPPSASMLVGQTQQITAQALDASGAVLTGRTITWQTFDASVATVTSTGLVTAVGPGLTSITATSEGRSVSTPLNVAAAVSDIAVVFADDIFEVGTTHQLVARVRDGNGVLVTNPAVTWASERGAVATVSSTGLLSIVGSTNDSVTVTATSAGKVGRFRFFAWPSLTNDVPVSVTGALDESRWYLVRVPAGTTRLTVTLSGGTGDADLFIWAPGTWLGAQQVCESMSPTTAESCTVNNPQAGLWSVEVYAYEPFANVQLRAVRTTP